MTYLNHAHQTAAMTGQPDFAAIREAKEHANMLGKAQNSESALVIIVDDEPDVRDSLERLFNSVGVEVIKFGSSQEMIEAPRADRPGCLILNVRMPGLSGLELQRRLRSRGDLIPVIFLSGFSDVPMTVEAMKAGAIDLLLKPFRDQALLEAALAGIETHRELRAQQHAIRQLFDLFSTLTPREKEVLQAIIGGRMNKQIAYDLGIQEVTVKLHRGNVMRKMEAKNLAGLISSWHNLAPYICNSPLKNRSMHNDNGRLAANSLWRSLPNQIDRLMIAS